MSGPEGAVADNGVLENVPCNDVGGLTVDEVELLELLDAARVIVDEVVGWWRELLIEKKPLPLAAVSLAANTRITELMTTFHAADILSPSCFCDSIDLTNESEYWRRLRELRGGEAVDKAFKIFVCVYGIYGQRSGLTRS